VSCTDLYVRSWKASFRYTGRARRLELVCFYVLNSLIAFLLVFVDAAIVGQAEGPVVTQPLTGLFSLAALFPTISIGVRRLHDMNASGWWLLAYFVPLLNLLLTLVLFLAPGTPGLNRFGPDPRAEVAG